MVSHLLPFLVYQPSLTAISIDTFGDSMRSPVSFSIAQATHTFSADGGYTTSLELEKALDY